MSYETKFGKNAEAAQDMFVDSIFAIDDSSKRKEAIMLLAECAIKHIPQQMAMLNIAKDIKDRYSNPLLLTAPTARQLDAFQSFLKHYKSRAILNEYQLRIVTGTNNTPPQKTDLERQVDELKERVAKLEAIIFNHYKN